MHLREAMIGALLFYLALLLLSWGPQEKSVASRVLSRQRLDPGGCFLFLVPGLRFFIWDSLWLFLVLGWTSRTLERQPGSHVDASVQFLLVIWRRHVKKTSGKKAENRATEEKSGSGNLHHLKVAVSWNRGAPGRPDLTFGFKLTDSEMATNQAL